MLTWKRWIEPVCLWCLVTLAALLLYRDLATDLWTVGMRAMLLGIIVVAGMWLLSLIPGWRNISTSNM